LFYFFNHASFQELGIGELLWLFVYGLRFDAFSICALSSMYFLMSSLPFKFYYSKPYQFALAFFFIVPNSIGLLLNFIDFAYYPFNNKRCTYNIIYFVFDGQTEILKLIPQFLREFWLVVLLFIALEYLFIKLYFKTRSQKSGLSISSNLKSLTIATLTFLIINGLCLLGIRGGLQRVPIMIIDAAAYSNANNIPLIINTPFFVIKSAELDAIETLNIIDQKQARKYVNALHNTDTIKKEFKNLNVCIIILESFSKEFTGIGNRKSFTPFFDSLMLQSVLFKNAIANGKTSIEGIPSIVASLPSFMNNPYINSIYSNNLIQTLATELKTKNYSSIFYHGGTNGSMNFNSFAKAAGFDAYYGRSEYNNDDDYDGHWGIYDEPFLQKVIEEISLQKNPFFSTIFTLSSHNPYKIPEKYKGKFPKGKLEIMESIGYADYSLKQFFNQAKKQTWFKNTLFVLCPDHTGTSEDYFYANPMGQYTIPIIFYKQDLPARIIYKTVQQIDIMPTILNYLNYDSPFYALGNDMFDTLQKPALYYISPQYYCLADSFFYIMNNYKFIEKRNVKIDSSLFLKLPLNKKDIEIETYCKSLIQTYNNDLLNNKMKVVK
jgi:phosphoglycerol transferase MdoB-like AlkP superfamily enzyme